jgi:hypothetical protein
LFTFYLIGAALLLPSLAFAQLQMRNISIYPAFLCAGVTVTISYDVSYLHV